MILLHLLACGPGKIDLDTANDGQITDSDADTDTDSDTDTDADTDADTTGSSGLLVFAKSIPECESYPITASIRYTNVTAGDRETSIEAETSTSEQWVSRMVIVSATDTVRYAMDLSSLACLGSGGSDLVAEVMGVGQIIVVGADTVDNESIYGRWIEGVDYSAAEVDVAFQTGTTAEYAESVLADFAVDDVVRVADSPLLFRVTATAGSRSVDLASSMLSADRVTFAVPSRL